MGKKVIDTDSEHFLVSVIFAVLPPQEDAQRLQVPTERKRPFNSRLVAIANLSPARRRRCLLASAWSGHIDICS
jgi:hypothetical protein